MTRNRPSSAPQSATNDAARDPGRNEPLRLRRLGIDTYQELIVFMRADCHVCRAEGFEALSRVAVHAGHRSVIATLNVVHSDILAVDEAGLSEAAWAALGAHEHDMVHVSHPEPTESFSAVRAKIYGTEFTERDLAYIIRDVVAGRYSSLELAAFVTACASNAMSTRETIALTRAMVDVGTRLAWPGTPIVDKHCVGGLPGNRTTPIIVAIVAACGLTIPKTSSRAITSPAGTADTMETMTAVELTLDHMRRVVEREGGCIVWGGSMALSPADDVLIRVERPLDFDSDAQLAASVMSKKVSAGSTHLIIDMPVGPTAKVRSPEAAASLSRRLIDVAAATGLVTRVVATDGTQPVGRGIGPALEALDVLAVLQNRDAAPADLRDRSLLLAGHLLELGGKTAVGGGEVLARTVLRDGRAWSKFQAICEAQGGLREPPVAARRFEHPAARGGVVRAIDNRRLAKVAKLAGAPQSAAAGLELLARVGDRVEAGQPLFRVHAESPGELAYAASFVQAHTGIIETEPLP